MLKAGADVVATIAGYHFSIDFPPFFVVVIFFIRNKVYFVISTPSHKQRHACVRLQTYHITKRVLDQ